MYKYLFFLTLVASTLSAQSSINTVSLESEQRTKAAQQWAEKNKYPMVNADKAAFDGWSLHGFENGLPIYFSTLNESAAITTNTNAARQALPYNTSGSGLSIGVWDLGSVLSNHVEVASRVYIIDKSSAQSHSTHVGGTLAASGINPLAKGMAPEAFIISGSYSNDFGEIPSWVANNPTEPLRNPYKVTISNHSYGATVGWVANVNYSGFTGFHYLDTIDSMYGTDFGRYTSITKSWDTLCYDYPYWLPFISAGNDRDDNAPAAGATFYYIDSEAQAWVSGIYDPEVHPGADHSKGGYDTVIGSCAGKNVMTVGAVNDAVTNGVRDLSKATPTGFSGWGPTDDGRIKPDIVANGASVTSLRSNATNTYNVASGTSMSSPNAAGSALLLQEYYSDFTAETMPSALLKGLIIHSADDLGRPGPDYENGWGVMNTKAALDIIKTQYVEFYPTLIQGELTENHREMEYTYIVNGNQPLRATLCWTDPEGQTIEGLDNPQSSLVHDLDMRIRISPLASEYREDSAYIQPQGDSSEGTTDESAPTSFYPYVLDPTNPTALASTGNNYVDNVEVIDVQGLPVQTTIKVTISFKNALTTPRQDFALVITGVTPTSQDEQAENSAVTDWAEFD